VALVDRQGVAVAHTGDACINYAGHFVGAGYSVQANMMTRDTVISAMSYAYENSTEHLAGRLIAALRAAQVEDGDIRGSQSAALLIVSGDSEIPNWKADYDVRVDEHPAPVEELARIVQIRRAQHRDTEGYALLEDGDLHGALEKWAEARALTPDQEELSYWQAVTLADQHAEHVLTAADIFRSAFDAHPRRQHWLDLIKRLEACGLIVRAGAGEELRRAIGD
jgi:uncharacterized Ntn-hydrolase superfamily protein